MSQGSFALPVKRRQKTINEHPHKHNQHSGLWAPLTIYPDISSPITENKGSKEEKAFHSHKNQIHFFHELHGNENSLPHDQAAELSGFPCPLSLPNCSTKTWENQKRPASGASGVKFVWSFCKDQRAQNFEFYMILCWQNIWRTLRGHLFGSGVMTDGWFVLLRPRVDYGKKTNPISLFNLNVRFSQWRVDYKF